MSTQNSSTKARRNLWPRISKTEHKNGTVAWMVDARIAGKGERLFFASKREAKTKADQLRTARKNHGAEAIGMPERVRLEAAECLRRLAAVGATLTEATDYYIRHAKPQAGAKTVQEVVADFLKAKEQAGRKAEYLRIQGHVLGYFGKTFDAREIHTISAVEISNWMLEQPWKIRTRENYRRDLGNLFGFAQKHGHCASNPLAKLERATLDDTPPGILTVKQCADLLTAAANTDDGAMVPYVAIGLFAGLRASELAALDWSEVSIIERTVEVRAHKAKTRARRIVTMSDNLAAWLAPYEKKGGPIAPREALLHTWARLRKAAGISPWPKNALRHSFGSYHVAAHRNAPQTSLEMGHDNPNQLFASYRELVRPADAAKYWEIAPSAEAGEKVVSIAA